MSKRTIAPTLARCRCGDPALTRVGGAKVTHTPERCGFVTGPVEDLRIDVPPGDKQGRPDPPSGARAPTREGMSTMRNAEQDRTILAERWAQAVAEVDELEGALKYARNREHAAWKALESSRAKTVPPLARLARLSERGKGMR